MKYIVVQITNNDIIREFPFIFPETVVHEHMFEQMKLEMLRNHNADSVNCVSAGFISCLAVAPEGGCHGQSESLSMKSRGEEDDKLFKLLDYTHGIVL